MHANSQKVAEKHNAAIQATTQAIHAQTVRLVDTQIQNVSVQMQALDEFVTRARSQNETHHSGFISNLSSLATNARESFDRFATDTTTIKADVETFGSEVAAKTAATKESLRPFALNARQPLSALRSNIEAAPMKEYVPTGQTPRKRRYEFTRTLPRTDSHERLLATLGGMRKNARMPLGEIEVLSPNKRNPEVLSVTLADPKAGGPGIGAAFYPAIAHKKGFGFTEPYIGSATAAGIAKDANIRSHGTRSGRDPNSGARMSSDENEEVGPPLKRTRNAKRKVVQGLEDRENAVITPILTRKRTRDR